VQGLELGLGLGPGLGMPWGQVDCKPHSVRVAVNLSQSTRSQVLGLTLRLWLVLGEDQGKR